MGLARASGLGAVVAVWFLLTSAPALPAASATGRSCAVPGSKTFHMVGKVRIYTFGNRLYACSTRYGRSVLLYKSKKVKPVSSALGAYAQSNQTVLAFVLEPPHLSNNGQAAFISRNLKTGAQIRVYVEPSCECGLTIYRLVTDAKGSFAWIEDDDGPGSVYFDYVIEDDAAKAKVLDEAVGGAPCIGGGDPACNEDINYNYLRAADGQVYWKGGPNGTAVRSASFN